MVGIASYSKKIQIFTSARPSDRGRHQKAAQLAYRILSRLMDFPSRRNRMLIDAFANIHRLLGPFQKALTPTQSGVSADETISIFRENILAKRASFEASRRRTGAIFVPNKREPDSYFPTAF